MSVKRAFHYAWGLFMGTSVPYLRPSHRPLLPVVGEQVDEGLALVLGGTANYGIVFDHEQSLIIGALPATAVGNLQSYLQILSAGPVRDFICLSEEPADRSGTAAFKSVNNIYVSGIESTRVAAAGGETVSIAKSKISGRVIAFLEKRRTLFLGGLFFHRLHPPLHSGVDTLAWRAELERLLKIYNPEMIIPGEGAPATVDGVRDFISYLADLSDPNVDFARCRSLYDWAEIPGYTSLEENFELLRGSI